MKYIFIVIGLVVGNFGYQAMMHKEMWAAAADRSIAQAVAVLVVWISDSLS